MSRLVPMTAFALLCSAVAAWGQCGTTSCAPSHRVSATTSATPVVVPVVEVAFVRYVAVLPLLDLPTYSATFAPPVAVAPQVVGQPLAAVGGTPVGAAPVVQSAPAAGTNPDISRMLVLLERMDARI